ncbi:AMP-binding protein [Reinekea sp.]|jgi:long-subunit acyl-CoA synthetase (AMP-forming)|uniref:AMP-binding protein n=1 Tax=Reinekea sp. TaxID=1970455 RepID=UPI002A824A1B|nr:AMP-binding protein [Reinekea sp.]
MTYQMPIEVLAQRARSHPDKPMFYQPVNRHWQVTSWQEAETQARRIASGLLSLGLQTGDRVAIYGKNSVEWYISDWAIMMAGLISVPIYATANAQTIGYVLEHSGAKAIFVGKLDDLVAAAALIDGRIPRIAYPYQTLQADHLWADWLHQFEPLATLHRPALEDDMTIVYTSGSTGEPKGVVLSYGNYASACSENQLWLAVTEQDRILSYLPLAHIVERGVIQGPGLYGGATIYFVESLDTFVDDLKFARPTVFVSVPRLWTKFQTGVFAKLPAARLTKLLRIPLLGPLLAGKIRRGLGLDKARLLGCGSAPISKSILAWYQSIGVNICEGWGMTETSGLSCSNLPFRADRVGTIGKPGKCVEMSLSDSGEILIRGDAVFSRYYHNAEETARSFSEGWFLTGDKATQSADGVYQIIGRVKESFKTAKGKYVAPVPIESLLAANPDIDQLLVMGSGRKQPVAIVVLAEHLHSADRDPLRRSLQATLDEVNSTLESHAQLDGMVVVTDSWSIENQLLTPTLKIRRSLLEARYNSIALQIQRQPVVWQDELGA